MADQKQKNCWQKRFAILNTYKPKTQLIKALNSIDSSISYGRLPQNPKTRGFRELFLPENDFKTYFTVKFSKKKNQFRLEFFYNMLFYI